MGWGWYKRASHNFTEFLWINVFGFYSPCTITRPVILLGDWCSPEHKIWTFSKVGRVKWKVFSSYLTTARGSHSLPPANLEPVISGDFYKCPNKLLLHCSGRDPPWALSAGSVLILHCSASQFLEISRCPLLFKPGPQTSHFVPAADVWVPGSRSVLWLACPLIPACLATQSWPNYLLCTLSSRLDGSVCWLTHFPCLPDSASSPEGVFSHLCLGQSYWSMSPSGENLEGKEKGVKRGEAGITSTA